MTISIGCNDLIQFKIVYWGPYGSGKTESFKSLCRQFDSKRLNKGCSIQTTKGTTLWQESVRLQFNLSFKEYKLPIITQICTTPGHETFLQNRKYVLSGADGVIFVADSNPLKMEENKRSFKELLYHINPRKIPFIIQLNKTDLDKSISIGKLRTLLGLGNNIWKSNKIINIFPTSAKNNLNVENGFQDLFLKVLFTHFQLETEVSNYDIDFCHSIWLNFKELQEPRKIHDIINEKYPLENYNMIEPKAGLNRFNMQRGYTFSNAKILEHVIRNNETYFDEKLKWDCEESKIVKTIGNALIYFFGFNIEKNGIRREMFREDMGFTRIYVDSINIIEEWKYRTRLLEAERRLFYHVLEKIKNLLQIEGIKCEIVFD